MLTFESIRDMERAERENKKLQKMPAQFFDDLQDYIRKKRADAAGNADDLIEYQNILAVVERLFELRERKILEHALDAARIGIPAENLHDNEKKLFEQLSDSLSTFRNAFFSSIRQQKQERSEDRLFRIKEDVPEFIGPDMKIYNLKQNDVVALPEETAKLLLEKGAVEEVK
ncbi:MAG: DNA replication complex GINS family protein [Candidatus Aenigmarchaeota archaeon]|nr:DNA replication complex GINS family protein [Candidatus Aenigmarchaeota archaeon]